MKVATSIMLAAALAAGGCSSRAAFTGGVATTLAGGVLVSQSSDDACADCTGIVADFDRNHRSVGVSMVIVGAVVMLMSHTTNGTSE